MLRGQRSEARGQGQGRKKTHTCGVGKRSTSATLQFVNVFYMAVVMLMKYPVHVFLCTLIYLNVNGLF